MASTNVVDELVGKMISKIESQPQTLDETEIFITKLTLAVFRARSHIADKVFEFASRFHEHCRNDLQAWIDKQQSRPEVLLVEEKAVEIWQSSTAGTVPAFNLERTPPYFKRLCKKDFLWTEQLIARAVKDRDKNTEEYRKCTKSIEDLRGKIPSSADVEAKIENIYKKMATIQIEMDNLNPDRAVIGERVRPNEAVIPETVWDTIRMCLSAISIGHFKENVDDQDMANLVLFLKAFLLNNVSIMSKYL
jgi:YesN/AraC family two-component response regulator